nr:MAG TPA: hypothetical protein [Bacteriophage sp.]
MYTLSWIASPILMYIYLLPASSTILLMQTIILYASAFGNSIEFILKRV